MAKKQKKVGIDQIHMQNAVKTLAANIRFASVDDPIRSIVVTSSVPNEVVLNTGSSPIRLLHTQARVPFRDS